MKLEYIDSQNKLEVIKIKLTEEQVKVVEENHGLIYGYLRDKGLDEGEYYGLLAIELCKSAMYYDKSKSALSTYFYMRCDSLLRKEYRKTQSQRRKHSGWVELKDEIVGEDNVEDIVILTELMNSEHGEIIRLRSEGYTQSEIADMMDISQAQVSTILKQLRVEYIKD